MTYRYAYRRRYDRIIIHCLDVLELTPKETAIELGISIWMVYRANKRNVSSETLTPKHAKQSSGQ